MPTLRIRPRSMIEKNGEYEIEIDSLDRDFKFVINGKENDFDGGVEEFYSELIDLDRVPEDILYNYIKNSGMDLSDLVDEEEIGDEAIEEVMENYSREKIVDYIKDYVSERGLVFLLGKDKVEKLLNDESYELKDKP